MEALRDRLTRVRLDAAIAVQSGLAAGLAWLIAHSVLHHARPFFAPIAAVIVLSASEGLRWRRAVELVLGVALGIGLADGLVSLVGVGVLQIVLVVTAAILITVLLGGGSLAVAQAASSAVLVVTLTPPGGALEVDRFVDALVGGLAGLFVMTLVLPRNPITRVRRSAGVALTKLADALTLVADSLRTGDEQGARRALTDLRGTEPDHDDLADSLATGREAATLAPLYWRRRSALRRYLHAAVHLERATRNVRVLARRAAAAVRRGEPVPAQLPVALSTLALAVQTLRDELAEGVEPLRARDQALQAVRVAGIAYQQGVGFSGSVVVAQVRSAAVDLLRATGLAEAEADRAVERVGVPV